LSWQESGEEALRHFKKGDDIETMILAIDPERERISLGIKQMEQDPYAEYMNAHPKNSILKGKVSAVEAKGATISLAEHVDGYLKVSDISRDRIEDARQALEVGQEVE